MKATKKVPQGPKIDLQKAIELRMKGLSYGDIAKYFGCSRPSVAERLKPYLDDGEVDVELFKAHRADFLALKQAQALKSLSAEKIEAASARDTAIVFGTLYDKERLERGQSTNNTSVWFHIIAEAPDLPGMTTTFAEVPDLPED